MQFVDLEKFRHTRSVLDGERTGKPPKLNKEKMLNISDSMQRTPSKSLLNSELHCSMLQDFMGKLLEDEIHYSLFQQDDATAHTANKLYNFWMSYLENVSSLRAYGLLARRT
ncbi:hypothetical protein ANN_24075 [Periplaneta americana]|uniref:Uncharacterized protein n=1 Tax=Periplaneta americana TaxID=6978 RepID=A0ABQ8S2L8_PERAM|nr:hypothetical protein ANN_24075 [Periplaneta americana]